MKSMSPAFLLLGRITPKVGHVPMVVWEVVKTVRIKS